MKVIAVVLATLSVTLGGIPWEPEERPDKWWQDKHNGFVENTLKNNGSIKVLFYGDSITEGWGGEGRATFEQYYAPLGTANYGIGGDKTEHLLWRVPDREVTDNLNPTLCVIMIGTNNLASNDVYHIAMGAVFEVLELRERLPNMKILVVGVLPRTNKEWTSRASQINTVLQKLDNGKTIRFLDMTDHFYQEEGGIIIHEMFASDLLHLSAAGYRKWAEVMDPLFREMFESF